MQSFKSVQETESHQLTVNMIRKMCFDTLSDTHDCVSFFSCEKRDKNQQHKKIKMENSNHEESRRRNSESNHFLDTADREEFHQKLSQTGKPSSVVKANTSNTIAPQWVCDRCGSVGLAFDFWCEHEEISLCYVID